jgi:uncharacterized protein
MLVLHLLIVYLSVVTPVWGYYSYKKFQREYPGNPGIKMAYYCLTVFELWTLAAVFAGYAALKGLPLSRLGFSDADWGSVSIMLLTALITYTAAPLVMMRTVPGYKELIEKQLRLAGDFLPAGQREKRFWLLVSATAGICEEWLFRSFMFYYFPLIIPGISMALVIVISSLLFGLGHSYQGFKGVLTTAFMGGLFGCLYYFTGSIVLCMVLHFLIDARIIAMLPGDTKLEG